MNTKKLIYAFFISLFISLFTASFNAFSSNSEKVEGLSSAANQISTIGTNPLSSPSPSCTLQSQIPDLKPIVSDFLKNILEMENDKMPSAQQLTIFMKCMADRITALQSIPFTPSVGVKLVEGRAIADSNGCILMLTRSYWWFTLIKDFRGNIYIDTNHSIGSGHYKNSKLLIGVKDPPTFYVHNSLVKAKGKDGKELIEQLDEIYQWHTELSVLKKIELYRQDFVQAHPEEHYPFPRVVLNPLDYPPFKEMLEKRINATKDTVSEPPLPVFDLISEFYRKGDLEDKALRKYPLSYDSKLKAIKTMNLATQILKKLKIIARDIKNGNVVRDENDNVSFIDFNLAWLLQKTSLGSDEIQSPTTMVYSTPQITPLEYVHLQFELFEQSKKSEGNPTWQDEDDLHRDNFSNLRERMHQFKDPYAFDRYGFAMTSLKLLMGRWPFINCYGYTYDAFAIINHYYKLISVSQPSAFKARHDFMKQCIEREHAKLSLMITSPVEKVFLKEIHPDPSLRYPNGETFFLDLEKALKIAPLELPLTKDDFDSVGSNTPQGSLLPESAQ